MKKFNQTIELYEFSELSDQAKDTVRNSYSECSREPWMFSEDVINALEYQYGLNSLKTYYSLSYCQGDGMCLYGEIRSDEIFENDNFKKIALSGLVGGQIASAKNALYKITFKHRGRYYHKNSITIDFEEDHLDVTDKQVDLMNKIVKNIEEWHSSFCDEWERKGYAFFYEFDDEEVAEHYSEIGCMFDIRGNVVDIEDLEEVA